MSTVTTDPFKAPTFAQRSPVACRLEVLELRSPGRKSPVGDLMLMPNTVRVNGVGLWCPPDDPIVVREIRVDGGSRGPLVVTLRLQARACTVGDETVSIPVGGDVLGNRFAVVEIPGLDEHDPDEGPHLQAGYAVVDGMKLALGGPVNVHPVQVSEAPEHRSPVVVELPLLCRGVVFDAVIEAPAGR